jgi:uncharacterized protein DUF4153
MTIDETTPPRNWLLAISAVQGLALFALYYTSSNGLWPSAQPVWAFPLWTLAITSPVVLLLSLSDGNLRSVLRLTAGLSFVLFVVAVYVGRQVAPSSDLNIFSITLTFTLSMIIAVFKALMYLQQRANNIPLTYEILFIYSWRNFLTVSLALIFVGGVALVLLMWSSLFSAIGVSLFADLFKQDWFLFPFLSIAFGLGVIIFRSLSHTLDSINKLLEGLIRLLLPLIVLVTLIFLATLPFIGLAPLWATGSGTSLLLWLTAVLLFSVNAVYQSGQTKPPYPLVIHRFIYCGVAVLPIICALSFLRLWLRIEQYGWTVERCWGMLVWVILMLFSVGYTQGILRQGIVWTRTLQQVNTYMGLGIAAIMLLVNTPLLDFRKISLSSQISRAESSAIGWRAFDFGYAHNHLGRPAYERVQQLLTEIGDSDPKLKELIENPRQQWHPALENHRDLMWEKMIYRPTVFDVPDDLEPLINEVLVPMTRTGLLLIKVDLTQDGVDEYVLVDILENGMASGRLFYRNEANAWLSRYLSTQDQYPADLDRTSIGALPISAERAEFDALKIGNLKFEVN